MKPSFGIAPHHVADAVMLPNVLPGFRAKVTIGRHAFTDHDERHEHNERKRCNLDKGSEGRF